MIDWFLAQRLARYVAGEPDARPPKADLRALAADSAERVIAYTGLAPARELPPAEGIGRAEWIAANVGSMRALLDPPLAKVGRGPRPGASRDATRRRRRADGRGRRPARLPRAARARPVRARAARHDAGGPAAAAAVRAAEPRTAPAARSAPTSASSSPGSRCTRSPTRSSSRACRGCSRTWRGWCASCSRTPSCGSTRDARCGCRAPTTSSGSPPPCAPATSSRSSPARRSARRSSGCRATMAVLEGHAEHVMDAVGAPLLPSLPRLRAALDARRRSQSAPARLLAAPARPGDEAQAVRAGQALLRRGRARSWRGGAQPRLERARGAAVQRGAGRAAAVAGANGRSAPPERLNAVFTENSRVFAWAV